MEYSKLRLWNENAEVADSLLMEYHASHADKPEKLGTTIRAVRMQLHENQVCVKTFGPFSLQQTVTGLVFIIKSLSSIVYNTINAEKKMDNYISVVALSSEGIY